MNAGELVNPPHPGNERRPQTPGAHASTEPGPGAVRRESHPVMRSPQSMKTGANRETFGEEPGRAHSAVICGCPAQPVAYRTAPGFGGLPQCLSGRWPRDCRQSRLAAQPNSANAPTLELSRASLSGLESHAKVAERFRAGDVGAGPSKSFVPPAAARATTLMEAVVPALASRNMLSCDRKIPTVDCTDYIDFSMMHKGRRDVLI